MGHVSPESLAAAFIAAAPDDPVQWVADKLPDLMGDAMMATFADLYYEAGMLGWISGKLSIERSAAKAVKPFNDWGDWEPGDPDAARLYLDDVDAKTGLQSMLDRRGITISGIAQSRYEILGHSLERDLRSGASMGQMANNITEQLGTSNSWAEMVARTETRFAVTAASLDSYRESGIEQVEWETAGGGCDECQGYADMGPVNIGEGFGDIDGPPAHPNCLCVILPVVPLDGAGDDDGVPVPVEDDSDDSDNAPEGSGPTAEPSVGADGFYDRDEWPQWAKDSDLAMHLDSLPSDRSQIGLKPDGTVDIHPTTGQPGPHLTAHHEAVKAIGEILDTQARAFLAEHSPLTSSLLRSSGERGLSQQGLDDVRIARRFTLGQIRPLDTGADAFAPLTDMQATALKGSYRRTLKGASAATTAAIQPSLDLFPSKWIDALKARHPSISVMDASRGFNADGGRVIAVSGRSPADRIGTMQHEIGHSMEVAVDGLRRLEWAELYARAARPSGKLPGLSAISPYGHASEKAFTGVRFEHRYSGRMYDSKAMTITRMGYTDPARSRYLPHFEVFSTGMQATFPRVLEDLAYADNGGGFQQFIMGLMGAL